MGGLRRCQRGFTYLVVLGAVAILIITAGVAEELASRAKRAERETELLFRGTAYVHAIESFYKVNGNYPRELQELVRDPHAAHRRHLRMLYPDPMAKPGAANAWQIVPAADGGIAGVVSTSSEEPLKKANFPKALKKFEDAKTYRDWVFDYMPRLRTNAPLPGTITTTTTTNDSP